MWILCARFQFGKRYRECCVRRNFSDSWRNLRNFEFIARKTNSVPRNGLIGIVVLFVDTSRRAIFRHMNWWKVTTCFRRMFRNLAVPDFCCIMWSHCVPNPEYENYQWKKRTFLNSLEALAITRLTFWEQATLVTKTSSNYKEIDWTTVPPKSRPKHHRF